MLQSLGSQRVRHNLATEQQQRPNQRPHHRSASFPPSVNIVENELLAILATCFNSLIFLILKKFIRFYYIALFKAITLKNFVFAYCLKILSS